MGNSERKETVVGIDFGTTTSAIGFVRDGLPVLLQIDNGNVITPTILAFSRKGETITGIYAKKQAVLNPERTFSSIKRTIGNGSSVTIDGKAWSFERMASVIIKKMVSEAGKALGCLVTNAVITVPAYFNDLQRKAVQKIGREAGLNVLRIINEPTAAAMAYGIDQEKEQNLLVFDFGGGTFDVSVLTISSGVFEVIATGGDNHLGGDDIDSLLLNDILKDFKAARGVDLSNDKMAMQKLKDETEKLKIRLSDSPSSKLSIPFITADENGPMHLEKEYTVEDLDKMIYRMLKKIITLAGETLQNADMKKADIDKIMLVGGSTRIPSVRNAIEKEFGKKLLAGINPVECVALGASIQGAIISGEIENMVLVDVIPLTLGVEIDGGDSEPLIEKNRPIPATCKRIFSTVVDNQEEVELRVLQGNSNRATENLEIGRFILGGIEIAGKGEPKIEVSFDIDVNGILSVSAVDKATGAGRSIRIDREIAKSDENGATV